MAQLCQDYGQRVQRSVFECDLGENQWAVLRPALLDTLDLSEDSLRFYFLGETRATRLEHHGVRPSLDFRGPLIV